jgi:hypothetical protein
LRVHIDQDNERRLRLAFTVKQHDDPDADFDDFADTVVNCLISESRLIDFSKKKKGVRPWDSNKFVTVSRTTRRPSRSR